MSGILVIAGSSVERVRDAAVRLVLPGTRVGAISSPVAKELYLRLVFRADLAGRVRVERSELEVVDTLRLGRLLKLYYLGGGAGGACAQLIAVQYPGDGLEAEVPWTDGGIAIERYGDIVSSSRYEFRMQEDEVDGRASIEVLVGWLLQRWPNKRGLSNRAWIDALCEVPGIGLAETHRVIRGGVERERRAATPRGEKLPRGNFAPQLIDWIAARGWLVDEGADLSTKPVASVNPVDFR